MDGVEFLRQIYGIIKSYNLPDDEDTYEAVENFLWACLEAKVQVNSKIWNKDLLERVIEQKITAPKKLVILNLLWKQPCKKEFLRKISDQHAAIIRDLRLLGFVFREMERSNGPASQFKSDDWMREIVGMEKAKPNIVEKKKISVKVRDQFLKGKRCPFSAEKTNLEVDHRQPVETCRKLGIKPVELTEELIWTGQADKHFQPISRSMNSRKREVCQKCRNNLAIILPDSIPKKAYKQLWDGNCVGCYYYNAKEPQYPKHYKADNL